MNAAGLESQIWCCLSEGGASGSVFALAVALATDWDAWTRGALRCVAC
jgi:hypothetical protein